MCLCIEAPSTCGHIDIHQDARVHMSLKCSSLLCPGLADARGEVPLTACYPLPHAPIRSSLAIRLRLTLRLRAPSFPPRACVCECARSTGWLSIDTHSSIDTHGRWRVDGRWHVDGRWRVDGRWLWMCGCVARACEHEHACCMSVCCMSLCCTCMWHTLSTHLLLALMHSRKGCTPLRILAHLCCRCFRCVPDDLSLQERETIILGFF